MSISIRPRLFRPLVLALLLFVMGAAACRAPADEQPGLEATQPAVALTPVPATPIETVTAPTATPLPQFNLDTLDLTGYLLISLGRPGLLQVDLATGQSQLLYEPPTNGLVISASLSADGSVMMLAYAPPPPAGSIQLGDTDLYTLALDGSGTPELFLEAPGAQEILFYPSWSADGQYVYYGRVISTEGGSPDAQTVLERIAFPDGAPEILVEDARWPAVSPDGEILAYVQPNRDIGTEELFIAQADGSEPRLLVSGEQFAAFDAIRFSPDGEQVLFSAVVRETTSDSSLPDWLHAFAGAQIARAHEVPSDLFTIPVSGGTPLRLTTLGGINLSPAYAPDGAHIAFSSLDEIQAIDADGSNLHQLLRKTGVTLVGWTP